MKTALPLLFSVMMLLTAGSGSAPWPAPKAPVIPEADGYVAVPGAAVSPQASRTYRAIFDATRAAGRSEDLLPALNMVGSELNALGAAGVPLGRAKFAVVFHGAAIDGILNDSSYKAKFGMSNPNLRVLAELRKAGVELYVCGQNLAFAKIEPKSLSPQVSVASDALIVLMTYQNDGYALLSF